MTQNVAALRAGHKKRARSEFFGCLTTVNAIKKRIDYYCGNRLAGSGRKKSGS